MEAQATFEALNGILQPYGKYFSVKQDDAEQYYLEALGPFCKLVQELIYLHRFDASKCRMGSWPIRHFYFAKA